MLLLTLINAHINAHGHHHGHHKHHHDHKHHMHDKHSAEYKKHDKVIQHELVPYVHASKDEIHHILMKAMHHAPHAAMGESFMALKHFIHKHFSRQHKLSLAEFKLLAMHGMFKMHEDKHIPLADPDKEFLFVDTIKVARKLHVESTKHPHLSFEALEHILFCPLRVLDKDLKKVKHFYKIITSLCGVRDIRCKNLEALDKFIYFIAKNSELIDDTFTLPEIKDDLRKDKKLHLDSETVIEQILAEKTDIDNFKFEPFPPKEAFEPISF